MKSRASRIEPIDAPPFRAADRINGLAKRGKLA